MEFDMKSSMIQRRDYSFAKIPAIFTWILNVIQALFTWWAIDVGGTGMEMAVLFPLFFIHIPSILPLLVSGITMIVVRKNKPALLGCLIPTTIYILQVTVFWLFVFYK